jgi:hypothetical protein
MNNIIDHLTSGIAVIVASIFGTKASLFIADAASEITKIDMPGWMTALQGPFGALVGLAVGLYWMSKRLNKAEEKADKREDERDADRKTLITVIEQNSAVLRDVKTYISADRKYPPMP